MKVFCSGLSRTGTTSLCKGLELIGFRACHFPFAMFGQPETFGGTPFSPKLSRGLSRRWRLRKELKALRCHDPIQILNLYDAFADLPVPLYVPELDRTFPDAKFIHTTRPIEDWLASMEWLLDRGRKERGWTAGELADELHYAIYGCTRFDEKALRNAFVRYEDAIASHFASRQEKLISLDISKGELTFQKIAPFLDRKCPDDAFPTTNAKG